MTNLRSRQVSHFSEFAILGLGIVVRLVFWQIKNYANDTFALKAGIVTHSLGELLLGPIGFGQSAPVGFALMSKIVGMATGYSDKALVFPVLIVGIATLVLLRKCLAEATISKAKIPFLFMFCFHPSLILYGTEFKPYAFDVFFAALFLLAATRGVDNLRDNIHFGLLCLVAPWFSLGAFFVIPVSFFILFVKSLQGCPQADSKPGAKIETITRPLLFPALCTCLSGVPSFLHLVLTMPETMDSFWNESFAPLPFSCDGFLWYVERLVRLFRGPIYFSFLPYGPSLFQLTAFAIPALFFFTGSRNRNALVRTSLLSAVLLVPLVVFASALRKWPLLPGTPNSCRLVLFFIPCVSIVLASGTEWLFSRSRPAGIVFSFFACATTVFFGSKLVSPRLLNSSESGNAIRTIVENWKPEDVIIADRRHRYVLIAEAWRWIESDKPTIVQLEETPIDALPVSICDTFVLLHPYNTDLSNCRQRLESLAVANGLTISEETNHPTILIRFTKTHEPQIIQNELTELENQ